MTCPLPTIEQLRVLLAYNPQTGDIAWRSRAHDPSWNSRWAGKRAFQTVSGKGYLQGRVLYRIIKAHRVAFALFHGRWPEAHIDHINGNRADNRIANLREVSPAENAKNCKMSVANKSGRTGVRWRPKLRRWSVWLSKQYIGCYRSFEAACEARAAAERLAGYHPNHGRSIA